jgi:hypothetical protein
MTPTEVTPSEAEKLSLHIYLTPEGYEKIKKCAEYAVLGGLIEGHPPRQLLRLRPMVSPARGIVHQAARIEKGVQIREVQDDDRRKE